MSFVIFLDLRWRLGCYFIIIVRFYSLIVFVIIRSNLVHSIKLLTLFYLTLGLFLMIILIYNMLDLIIGIIILNTFCIFRFQFLLDLFSKLFNQASSKCFFIFNISHFDFFFYLSGDCIILINYLLVLEAMIAIFLFIVINSVYYFCISLLIDFISEISSL